MSHESLVGSPGELREGVETAFRSHGILQHAAAAFAGVEMGPIMGQGAVPAMAQRLHPHPDPPPSRGRELSPCFSETSPCA